MSIAVPRSGWGARAPTHRYRLDLPAPDIWIHHEANAMPGDWQPKADEIAEMREIQNYHMDVKGWSDIAYNHVICDSGRVYDGRGWGIKGGHTENHNSTSHGICFAGNFQKERPTLAALDACRQLIAEGKAKGYVLNRRQPTGGHRDTKPTACPGDNLYAKLDYLRVPWKEDDMAEEDVQYLKGIQDRMKSPPRPRSDINPANKARIAGWDFANAALKPGGEHEHNLIGKAT